MGGNYRELATRPDAPPSTTYSDAEVRGRLRQWKAELHKRYRVLDRAFSGQSLASDIDAFRQPRSPVIRRQRTFARISQFLAPAGVTLEGVRFDGKAPVAVWSILKPRTSVMLNDPSEAQNCVTVNHFAIGAFDGGMGERGGRLKFPTMRWDGYCTGVRLIRRAASPPPITRRYGCAVRT